MSEPGKEAGQLEPLPEASPPQGAQRQQQGPEAGGGQSRQEDRAGGTGLPNSGLRKGMAAEVPETGLSLPSRPESVERLVEQKGTQGSEQLLVSQRQSNKGR